MTVRAPIREEMFTNPGIMSKIWIKFFHRIEETVNISSSEQSEVLKTPNSISSTVESTSGIALALLSHESSTNTSKISTDNILTLYWMGV